MKMKPISEAPRVTEIRRPEISLMRCGDLATRRPITQVAIIVIATAKPRLIFRFTSHMTGTFKTMRYEVYLFNNVLYKRPAHLNVWLSDDRRRLPVQIRVRMTFTIGTINLQLEKHE